MYNINFLFFVKKLKSLPFFTSLFCILIFYASQISVYPQAQDQRNDSEGIYLLPHEVILKTDLEKIEKNHLDEKVEIGKKIEGILSLLAKYYTQFLSDKRIYDERTLGKKFKPGSEPEQVRKWIQELTDKKAPAGLIRDSNILFQLHSRLGEYYEKENQFQKAVETISTALKYRRLSATEDYFLDEKRLNEIDPTSDPLPRKVHLEELNKYQKAKSDHKKTEDEFHQSESTMAYAGKNTEIYSGKNQRFDAVVNSNKLLKEALKNYNSSLVKNYLPFQKSYNQESAKTLVALAKMVKIIENENKERSKVENKSSFGKGIFVLFDYKRNTNFFGYVAVLEKAHDLDPENTDLLGLLGAELRSSGKIDKALVYYLRAEENYKKKNSKVPAEVLLQIASIYSEMKKDVLAGGYYIEYIESEEKPDKKNAMYFQVGDFFANRIKDLEKGAKYFQYWLATVNDNAQEQSFSKDLEKRSGVFKAHLAIAGFNRLKKNYEEELKNLQSGNEKLSEIKNILESEQDKYSELEKKINEIKKELLVSSKEDVLAQYRILEMQKIELKDRIRLCETSFSRIKKAELFFRMAEIHESNKDFVAAEKLYLEMADSGNENEKDYSLKKVREIRKILENGVRSQNIRLF